MVLLQRRSLLNGGGLVASLIEVRIFMLRRWPV